VDELFFGKLAFLTVVSDLDTGEPICLGRERKTRDAGPVLGRGLAPPAPPVRPGRLRRSA
jgi:hypothetical protein